jgi:hypothetical protein
MLVHGVHLEERVVWSLLCEDEEKVFDGLAKPTPIGVFLVEKAYVIRLSLKILVSRVFLC